ncbi:hypothetical protein [Micromonospora sp. CB01531]|uniref:hypothetical protein n=1 Tax=Micromonospora sp. CB01531 TaxID=1718947 RepID=UPI00093B1983|nr:hypothetical protein [Micromonospora sp. CB01531]OKI47317.1 hypothetical protein A6A27_10745 [Micromonospora sp. CB01531]
MQPTIGRVVHYTLNEFDAESINRRRKDFADQTTPGNTGFQGHVGNAAEAGHTYPAVVVRTFGGSAANLKVLLDGNDDYWATSRTEGEPEQQGCWIWPPRV